MGRYPTPLPESDIDCSASTVFVVPGYGPSAFKSFRSDSIMNCVLRSCEKAGNNQRLVPEENTGQDWSATPCRQGYLRRNAGSSSSKGALDLSSFKI